MEITRRQIWIVFAALSTLVLIPFISSKVIAASGLDDDVKLLLHGGGSSANVGVLLQDSSFSNHTVTLNGNAASATDKFSQSAFFDGTGDSISHTSHADWNFGTGDFTIDFWIRPSSGNIGDGRAVLDIAGHAAYSMRMQDSTTGNGIQVYVGGSIVSATTNSLSASTWYHIAHTRSGNTLRLFINGVQVDSDTNSTSISGNLSIGTLLSGGSGSAMLGSIDELRISKGVARWTSNFTPPTSPHTSDGNTSLLLHMDGTSGSTTFTDSSGSPKTVTTNGDAHIGSFSKFGGDGISFDGSGDYVSLDGSSDFEFGSGDFTIDFWFRPESVTSTKVLYDHRGSCGSVAGRLTIYTDGTALKYYVAGDRITGGTLAINQWYHVAVARSGTATKMFLDGTQVGSTYTDSNNYTVGTSRPVLGICGDTGSSAFRGNIDEVRVSKGVARWTSNFTPPTEEYGLAGITLSGNVKFLRNIAVVGSLSKGAGTFVIDHPQKPRTHLLYHSFVESNEVKNLYDGIAELDRNGEAVIRLPDYFEELNKDFRYQYFPIGEAMPNLHVKEKVKNNQFVLAGGKPNGRVSWQVTGVRHDPYIEANPLQVEVEKGPGELVDKGECLHEVACP